MTPKNLCVSVATIACLLMINGGHGIGMVLLWRAGSGILWLVKVMRPFFAISKNELCLCDHSMAPFSHCIMSLSMSCDASIVFARAARKESSTKADAISSLRKLLGSVRSAL